ncbi:probable 39S ribosomal protein L45, mitochondrial isoform X2 [Ceratina calcarata]|uniref:Large ribosomal subunit protein mL45 n=1 Tax=Ceratina calcarata TaxID=156304 RepID=A0AAJ7J8H8_9HYME|nr:probable 39S ribosomal protein L45, mitochondrial isoform X1 [Ceratina calcarata]XP_017886810.1 probable 39S ribosomal protein L45, mitochondrial isoform X2 [Ceratina calcarata]
MISRYRNSVCIFGKYMQNNLPLMLGPINYPVVNDPSQQVRNIKKHFNPKYRKERAMKFIKIELPDFDDSNEEVVQERFRSRLKRHGILPQRNWQERPVLISSTPQIFETYVVPEGDGKFSPITKAGAKQKVEFIGKKSKSYLAIRKIKSFEEDFHVKAFAEEALEIYKKAHETLAEKDEEKLLQYVTEAAFPVMTHNMEHKTIVWKFVESLEPARIVHARVTNIITKDNFFAQITVRFHTQQYLCIYDRFGRVLLGSETVKKDVLDYIVFEKHLSNTYGTWRVHGKIVPDWMTPEEIPSLTYVLPEEKEPESPTSVESVAQTVTPDSLDKKTPEATT